MNSSKEGSSGPETDAAGLQKVGMMLNFPCRSVHEVQSKEMSGTDTVVRFDSAVYLTAVLEVSLDLDLGI